MKTPGWKSWTASGAALLALLSAGPSARAQDLNMYWKDSLRIEGEGVKLRIGGRVHNDWGFFDQDGDVAGATVDGSSLDQEDGVEFRRARLYLSGTIHDNMEFKFQYDFAGGDADFKDVYVGLTDLGCFGGLRVGQFKEPFSLEELTSSNDITFMERSLLNTFSPSRSTGIMLHDQCMEDRATWAVGVFRDSNDYGDQEGSGEWAWTARSTFLPVDDAENDTLVHLGAGVSLRAGDMMRYRARPESHFFNRYASTRVDADGDGDLDGSIPGNDETAQFNLEAAGVWGPLSVQGEYTMVMAESSVGSDPDLDSWYAQVSYLLTGESRNYDRKNGVFKNPKAARPYGEDGGMGAWEAAVRYSSLDLDDGMVMGGEMDNISVGLNWYLNNNARMMFNYVLADLDGWDDSGASFDGDTNIFMVRFQLAF